MTEVVPIWRSDIQPVILHRLGLGVDRTASDIAASAGLDASVVARQVRPFLDAEILRSERIGRSNLLRLNYEHPATTHLLALANLTVGLLVDLAELFEMPGVLRVVVFGSWARRHHGEPGPRPRDIDVFVETTPGTEPWSVQEAAMAIGGRHGVAIDLTALPSGTMSRDFAASHLDGPVISIDAPKDSQ